MTFVLQDCLEFGQSISNLENLLQLGVLLDYGDVTAGVVEYVVAGVGRVGRVDAGGQAAVEQLKEAYNSIKNTTHTLN